MARYIDLNNPKIIHMGRDKYGNGIYHIPPDLPTADVRENVKGKWIATQEWGGRNYSCSCCKFSFIVGTCMLEPMWNFCPNCGALMVKGEDNEL